MTVAHLEAELSRVRFQEVEDPEQRRVEVAAGIRNRAALLERFFFLGASASMNHNETPLEGAWEADTPVTLALRELAEEIVVGATWLEALRDAPPATDDEAEAILQPVMAAAKVRRDGAAKGAR